MPQPQQHQQQKNLISQTMLEPTVDARFDWYRKEKHAQIEINFQATRNQVLGAQKVLIKLWSPKNIRENQFSINFEWKTFPIVLAERFGGSGCLGNGDARACYCSVESDKKRIHRHQLGWRLRLLRFFLPIWWFRRLRDRDATCELRIEAPTTNPYQGRCSVTQRLHWTSTKWLDKPKPIWLFNNNSKRRNILYLFMHRK